MGVSSSRVWLSRGWWVLAGICAVYAGFAVALAGVEIASWVDPTIEGRMRALPRLFVVHALAGAVALGAGPMQFHAGLRGRSPALHRVVGRAYVYGVWVSSATAAALAPSFDVPAAARVNFVTLAVLWFTTTSVGLWRILHRRIREHREWMLRSFALSLFFVTGPFWMELSRTFPDAEGVAYPLAVLLGWALNLAGAEAWIRKARRRPTPLRGSAGTGAVTKAPGFSSAS